DAGTDGPGAREQAVLAGLVDGLPVSAIAFRLDLSPSTVGDYSAAIYRKLGATTRATSSPPTAQASGRDCSAGRRLSSSVRRRGRPAGGWRARGRRGRGGRSGDRSS